MVSVLSPNENGDTALMLAVKDELTDTVVILLDKWKHFRISQVHYALEHLIHHHRWSFIRDFLKNYHGDRISHLTLRGVLRLAIEKENLDTILLMLENNVWEKQLKEKYINDEIKRMDVVKREERIFELIKMKIYLKVEEIQSLLGENKSQYDIPWTIRDEKGASILHYIVSSPSCIDFQYDIQNEITQLMNSKDGPYINAVDFEGKTCLHYLAELTGIHFSNCIIKKYRQEARIISIIEILIKFGANAALSDYSGKLPEELAKLPKTEYFLKEQRKAITSKQETLNEFPYENDPVLEAASNGEDTNLKKYLQKQKNTLRAQNGYSGPLHIAIAQGHWKTVQLLLSAGAPLSDISNEGFTVLETAYRTENLHARMHALIRHAYINQLNYELRKVIGNNNLRATLKKGIRQLVEDIKLKGYNAKWPKQAYFRDNWKLLLTAAKLGLSLTCHFICFETYTRVTRLPGDKQEHPVCIALSNSHIECARVLCIDHKLHPYHLPPEQEKIAFKFFNNSLFLEEFEKIKNLPTSNLNCNNISIIKKMSSLIHEKSNVSVDNEVLRFIAENGLLHTLNKIINKVNLDLNEIVDTVSRSGLIHIAARYGHIILLEYLVLSGANTSICAQGKLTPAHLSALFGHTRCWEYLKCLPGGQEDSLSGMDPESSLKGFQEMVKTLKLHSLDEEEKSNIYNNPQPRATAQILLNNKGKHFDIGSPKTLLQCAMDKKVDLEDFKNTKIQEAFELLFKSLVHRVGQSDNRFEGELVPAGSVAENIRLHFLDELDYNVVLKKFHAMDNGNINIETVWNADTGLKDIRLIPDEKIRTHDRMIFEERNLITEFKLAVENVLSDPAYEFGTQNLSLVYPGISETRVGIALYFVWSENDETSRILLPSVDLVPAIPAPLPEDTGLKTLPHESQDMLKNKNVCIVCCGKSQWRYSLSSIENVLLSNLELHQRAVILACKLLCSFLKPDWWYPEEFKRFYQVWKNIYLKIDVPVSYVIKAAFIKELAANTKSDSWTEASFINHVISIFERMIDESHKPKQVKSFFVPSYESQRFGDGAYNFLEYLNNLKKNKF
ncbi:unnamed protein product [Meganyctiphanes norvegica]|uniref:Uncharacterized protein n=1 Tax=Meganyctiphanes norvegica TaxID=48144 RepID=A0AAV2R582_MEGNR